jgi:hypothetical protein
VIVERQIKHKKRCPGGQTNRAKNLPKLLDKSPIHAAGAVAGGFISLG